MQEFTVASGTRCSRLDKNIPSRLFTVSDQSMREISTVMAEHRLGNWDAPRYALMLLILSGSISLGCHDQSGRCAAKCTQCWPVPLAISNTSAFCGNTSFKT